MSAPLHGHCDSHVERGTNAVQEEFDEHGWGDASLLVAVILDESGYPAEVARLQDILGVALEELTGFDDPADAHRLALLDDFITVAKAALSDA